MRPDSAKHAPWDLSNIPAEPDQLFWLDCREYDLGRIGNNGMSRRQQGGRTTTITSNEAHADGKEERKKGAEMEMRKAFLCK